MVRRIVLGPDAADDTQLTALLDTLRAEANWGYAWPRRRRTEEALARRLARYTAAPHPDSLAGATRSTGGDEAGIGGQVPHWLFAYDAAGIAAFATLILLAAHPDRAHSVFAEVQDTAPDEAHAPARMPWLRASVLEALRLWPTTLVLLRDPVPGSPWAAHADTVAIVSSFFHRDAETLEFADRFAPDAWLDGRADEARGIVPFSAGPTACPGRDLVLYTIVSVTAEVLRGTGRLRLLRPALDSSRPLPHTLDHAHARIALREAEGAGPRSPRHSASR
ncbi:cytochrome P450 [Uniformispora flossi]|uniref:cytochrome P450 n=1 Tax=Uniformispora flossi TaxID=3390723 RepID=UPI003C2F9293